jgi:hypothetical protein
MSLVFPENKGARVALAAGIPAMPLRESDIVRLAARRFSTRCMKGCEGSDEGGSSTRSDTDDDSPVVDTSGRSEVSSSGDEEFTEGKGAIDDVALERRVLFEGGMAGLGRAVDCRPRERWAGGIGEKMVD